MKINFKKVLSALLFPFRMVGKFLKAIWQWARKRIIKTPASEAEAFLMTLAVVLCCVWVVTIGTLVETRYIIQEKTKIIQEQAKVIETYKVKERTVRLPGKVKVVNVTVQQLQQEIAESKQEAAQLRREKTYYQHLVRKYSRPAPSGKTPAQRVETEEQINDQFIIDWSANK
ncbi:MAG: hypothetical protein M0R77_13075 [Gammaproteobacteria bacterium]|nr:hypothetical protein [Gammaproteobacteria bacterium]